LAEYFGLKKNDKKILINSLSEIKDYFFEKKINQNLIDGFDPSIC